MHLLAPVLALVLAAAAGCSDSSTTNGSETSGSASAAAGLAAAKKFVQDAMTISPTVGIDPVLPAISKMAPADKTFVALVNPAPTAVIFANAIHAATDALGWKFREIQVGTAADGIQTAFDSALQLVPAPSAIWLGGSPKSTYSAQLAQAKAKGIPVVEYGSPDTPNTGDGIIFNVQGPAQVYAWGEYIAAFAIADSNGNAKVVDFDLPSFPVLASFSKGIKDTFAKWCPGCQLMTVNQQLTDIGTKTPQSVVSTFQTHPDYTYAVFPFGDLALGVPTALKSAGLSNTVKIIGGAASDASLADVKAGAATAWINVPNVISSWRIVDAVVRYYAGDSLAIVNQSLVPQQIITGANVGQAATDSNSHYIGVADYQAQFKKLWLLG